MGFKIDKGITPPRQNAKPVKYPWPEMGIDDSFFVPGRSASHMSTAAKNWSTRNQPEWVFQAESRIEGEVKGARVWRVE